MSQYRITVIPSPDLSLADGEWEFTVKLTGGGVVCKGYGNTQQYALEAGEAAAQRHYTSPPVEKTVDFEPDPPAPPAHHPV